MSADCGPIAAPFVMSRSSPPRTPDAVPDGKDAWKACDAALDWLVRHQRADGSWDSAKPGASCTDGRCAEPTGSGDAIGDTALAVLAIGATGWGAPRVRAFDDGLGFLRTAQASDGSFSGSSPARRVLDQAWATEALCRFIGEKPKPEHRDAATRAAAHLLSLRTPGAAWSLGANAGERCDLRATTWATMALADARLAGVSVPDDVYRDVLMWLGTTSGGSSVGDAAMRACCRLFCGTTQQDPRLLAELAVLQRGDEKPDADREALDAATRHLATVAEYYLGGDVWKGRRRSNVDPLARQHGKDDACLMGSWDGDRPVEPDGDRVGATALTSMLFDAAYISTYRNAVSDKSLVPK